MKVVAWLAGIGTMLAGLAYMVVSLNRWEWNRALFFGLIVVIAEVGLATGLVLRRVAALQPREADPAVLGALRSSRPAPRDRFAWLEGSAGQLQVFITFLVGAGVGLSGLAWLVDKVASRTTTPVREERLARRLGGISYPTEGLVGEEPDLVRLLRRPG